MTLTPCPPLLHLDMIQRDAWATAEAKGLHQNLDGVTSLGVREQALIQLAAAYAAVTAITQLVKRQGLDSIGARHSVHRALYESMDVLDAMDETLAGTREPLPVDPEDVTAATVIRLVLAHTELDEAAELALSVPFEVASARTLMRELADEVVRVADLAECLLRRFPGPDGVPTLAEATAAVLAANKQRPYKYGTPGEQHVS